MQSNFLHMFIFILNKNHLQIRKIRQNFEIDMEIAFLHMKTNRHDTFCAFASAGKNDNLIRLKI